jgi:hypothetical protein
MNTGCCGDGCCDAPEPALVGFPAGHSTAAPARTESVSGPPGVAERWGVPGSARKSLFRPVPRGNN